ncbi:GNAT family N-acetyltransferase [Kribbella kalugense]|uniref:Acetyltransferase (GNAT) family protein n=1 Tax=Kribbella kalugense TaxID=2512221 RepID=A0A4V3G747_9ACTN|nr:GNAT family N-acetyltransferase [Kribbella kalugense]TDW17704.1 hypothetical protein EV650_4279 [Kribbella kalugense]
MPVSRLEITTVADRPELAHADIDVGYWPEFMRHNHVSAAYFAQVPETFPATCLIATAGDSIVGDAQAVQLAFGSELPAGGWEQAVVQAFSDVRLPATAACALNISVAQTWQGQGVAALLLTALRDATARLGLADLYAPVRPTAKHLEPGTPMREYASRTRSDGLPADPWLRTHVRAGGLVAGIAPASWVVAGSLAEWREWTGLPFDRTGPVEVPGALSLVDCSLDEDRATYVEANIWVRHRM